MGLAGGDGGVQGRSQLGDGGDAGGAEAVGVEQLGEVGVDQVGGEETVTETVLLVLLQHSPGVVVEHQDDRVDAVLGGGGEFLEVVLEAAVAGDADHRAVGLADLGAQASGESEAETGPAVGVHVLAWAVDGQTARGATGGHGRVQRENGLAGGNFADSLEHPQFVAPSFLQVAVDVILHRCHFISVRLAFAYVAVSDGVEPLPRHGLGVGDDGHRGIVVLAYGITIQQDVDHRIRQLELYAGGRAVGHYRAEDNNGVAGAEPVLHRVLAPDAAAQHLTEG